MTTNYNQQQKLFKKVQQPKDLPGGWKLAKDGPGVTDIDSVVLRGKIQTFAMAFTSCDDLTIEGLTFFSTALMME